MSDEPNLADLLADLNRAKCAFQLRALAAVMGLDGQAIEARSAKTAGLGPQDESAVGDKPMHQDTSKVGG